MDLSSYSWVLSRSSISSTCVSLISTNISIPIWVAVAEDTKLSLRWADVYYDGLSQVLIEHTKGLQPGLEQLEKVPGTVSSL